MSTIRRILVAVTDPGSRKQPALVKGAHLARRMGASLEILHCLFSPRVQGELVYGRRVLEKDIESRIEAARQQLERRAARLVRGESRIRVSVRWDYPPHEAIIRQALRHGADLVIAETQRRGRLSRLFLTNSDWQLIRLCPVPLVLVKSTRRWTAAKVLAAIDPLHARARPSALDPRILKVATQLARALGSDLHAMHAYAPLMGYAPGALTEPVPFQVTGREARDHGRRIRKRVISQIRRFVLSERRVHVVEGDPIRAVPNLARRLGAQIVVLGAVSRSGLKRLFIGNTAERVIDALTCDLCVVKAPGFRTPVPARPPHLPTTVSPWTTAMPPRESIPSGSIQLRRRRRVSTSHEFATPGGAANIES